MQIIDDTRVRHALLEETGWFTQFWGPSGAFPVQMMGQLTTGETVYFRARGNKITLEVAACADDLDSDRVIARFRKDVPVDGDNEFGASMMDEDAAAELIQQWLGEFFGGARPVEPRR